ncbi:Hypothetical_protein [Hexamita inflata]|uniref:Hypothetical_protein n=1 Tax=Hexamita inflata TaxID=28002 RepID=A0AA86TYZ8_9EUKA|nr:Hypothetical protein HINF_LOCUS21614 [Hexamita inflata]
MCVACVQNVCVMSQDSSQLRVWKWGFWMLSEDYSCIFITVIYITEQTKDKILIYCSNNQVKLSRLKEDITPQIVYTEIVYTDDPFSHSNRVGTEIRRRVEIY